MNVITISKKRVNKQGGVVVLSLKEYQKLCERVVPVYYLKGKEADKLDKLVKDGLKAYRGGSCGAIKSLADIG